MPSKPLSEMPKSTVVERFASPRIQEPSGSSISKKPIVTCMKHGSCLLIPLIACDCPKHDDVMHKRKHEYSKESCIACLRDYSGVSKDFKRNQQAWRTADLGAFQRTVGRLFKIKTIKNPDTEILILMAIARKGLTPRIAGLIQAVYGCEVLQIVMEEHMSYAHE